MIELLELIESDKTPVGGPEEDVAAARAREMLEAWSDRDVAFAYGLASSLAEAFAREGILRQHRKSMN